jgi:uncharacterized metal-binding protein
MRFESHAVFATAISISIPFLAKEAGLHLSLTDHVQIMTGIILGGAVLSCDIDTNSKASRYYAIASLILTAYWLYIGYYLYPLIVWIPFGLAKSGKHRGITHSWLLPVGIVFLPIIIDFIMFYTKFNIGWIQALIYKYRLAVNGYALGICTHLFIDIKVFKKIARRLGGEKLVKILYG